MIKLIAQSVRVFELRIDNKVLGLFRQVSTWNEFKELRRIDGESRLIVAPKAGLFERQFSEAIGGAMFEQEFVVLTASPDIASVLREGASAVIE